MKIFGTKGNLAEAIDFKEDINEEIVNEDNSLIILQDWGYDTGRFSHVKILFGMVDVRTLTSEISDDGYQRTLIDSRVEELAPEYHKSKFDQVTISLRGGRLIIDGQCRSMLQNVCYERGIVDTPMVPCKILQYATKEDEALLFATQDEGKTELKPKERTKGLVVAKDESSLELNSIIDENGMSLYKKQKDKKMFSAHAALVDKFDETPRHIFKRVIYVISSSFNQGKDTNATSAEMLKGLICFYTLFENEIDDKSFIEKLKRYTPKEILNEFKKYNSKLDDKRKYLKAFVMIYNKNRKVNRISYE